MLSPLCVSHSRQAATHERQPMQRDGSRNILFTVSSISFLSFLSYSPWCQIAFSPLHAEKTSRGHPEPRSGATAPKNPALFPYRRVGVGLACAMGNSRRRFLAAARVDTSISFAHSGGCTARVAEAALTLYSGIFIIGSNTGLVSWLAACACP